MRELNQIVFGIYCSINAYMLYSEGDKYDVAVFMIASLLIGFAGGYFAVRGIIGTFRNKNSKPMDKNNENVDNNEE